MRPCVLALLWIGGCARRDARELLDELQGDDYRSFERAPGWETPRRPTSAPHGDFVDIYINDVLSEVFVDGGTVQRWPEGSIIIKDGWHSAEGGSLAVIAVMEKTDGEWFYAEYAGNGRVKYAGTEKHLCTKCHNAGDDHVLAFDLP